MAHSKPRPLTALQQTCLNRMADGWHLHYKGYLSPPRYFEELGILPVSRATITSLAARGLIRPPTTSDYWSLTK